MRADKRPDAPDILTQMISLVATVYNEADGIGAWLDGLAAQSLAPDEIVITDGGSTDGTAEILHDACARIPSLRVFPGPGNISKGRNAAIAHAKGDIIVVTDAGCSHDPDWLREIVRPIVAGSAVASATAFAPRLSPADPLIVRCIASATAPASGEFVGRDWLPSSRSVAFLKSAWERVGGYPEWIPICEDIIFDLKILKTGISFALVRRPLVFWQPRQTVAKFMRQVFMYTRSDGHGKLWLGRQLIRYGVYFGALAVCAYAVPSGDMRVLLVLAVLGCLYIVKFVRRFMEFSRDLSLVRRALGILLIPLVVFLGDLAKMAGWPLGVYERLTGKISYEPY